MKPITVVLILLAPVLMSFQHRHRLLMNDIQRFGLQGKVKSYKHTEFEPEYLTDSTYKLRIYNFLAPHNFKTFFNEEGYVTEKIEFKLQSDSLKRKGHWLFEYDEQNRISRELYYWNNYGNDTSIWSYHYPEKGITYIVKRSTSSPRLMYYSYRQEEDKEHFRSMNADSSYTQRNLNIYDRFNRLVRTEEYEDKEYIQHITLKSYKDSLEVNPEFEVFCFTKYNGPVSVVSYKYDDKNNVLEQDVKNAFFRRDKTVSYIYDEQGNWIEKREIDAKGKVFRLFKREFEYY